MLESLLARHYEKEEIIDDFNKQFDSLGKGRHAFSFSLD